MHPSFPGTVPSHTCAPSRIIYCASTLKSVLALIINYTVTPNVSGAGIKISPSLSLPSLLWRCDGLLHCFLTLDPCREALLEMGASLPHPHQALGLVVAPWTLCG